MFEIGINLQHFLEFTVLCMAIVLVTALTYATSIRLEQIKRHK